MNYTLLLLLLAMPLFIALIHLLKIYFHHPKNNKLPPGPKRIPVFGNIFNLGEKRHRSFTDLAKIYGPIISVKLGSITTIIVSSSKVAREMLLKNDHVVSNRTINDSIKASNHDKLSMSWLPVSQKWRHLRKIAATQLLSTQRLDSDESLRLAKVEKLLEYVQECCNLGLSVDIGRAAFTTILNLLSTTCFSKELLAHYSSSKSQEFKHLMWNIMEEMGRPNYVDYFPMLRFMDPFSVRRRLSNYFDKLTDVFKEIIDERLFLRKKLCGKDNTNDVLSSLLNLYEQNELSMGEIYHLLVDFFDAGTETPASTLEWAMAELVKNPNIMTKVQNEFQQVLGNNHRLIQESHIDNLPYFQAIIKETFRLHPSTALLPRKAEVDVSLYGYVMPKNAQILVNIWAIGRDPKVWDHPEVFEPERFMGRTLDFKGPDFELLTFGAGRRICPGIGFANRMLSLMLANLLHSFDWKLDNGMEPKDLDMEEKFGMTLQKLVPLQLIPISKK